MTTVLRGLATSIALCAAIGTAIASEGHAQGAIGGRGGAVDTRQGGDSRGPTYRVVTRADAFLARVDAYHAGAGATTDLGSYVRLDAVVGAGIARAGEERVGSARAEVVGRFLLDPYRQSRWGVYAGGGLILRHDDGPGTSGYVTLLAGAELPGAAGMQPALELGIGGGTRIGLVLRRGRPNRR